MTDFPKANVLRTILSQMKAVPYSLGVGSLMYAQVCTHPDIVFVGGVLDRYLSDYGQSHWKAIKKVLRYLQGTKDLMLTSRRTDTLEVVGFSDSNYASCVNDKKFTSRIFVLVGVLPFYEFCKKNSCFFVIICIF